MKSSCPQGKQTFSLFCISLFYICPEQNWNKCKFTQDFYFFYFFFLRGRRRCKVLGFYIWEEHFSKAELLKQRQKGVSSPFTLLTEHYLKCGTTEFHLIFLFNLFSPELTFSLANTPRLLLLDFSLVFPLKLGSSFQFL